MARWKIGVNNIFAIDFLFLRNYYAAIKRKEDQMTKLESKGHPLEIWAIKKGINSQEAIAVKVNVSARTIFNIIRGKTVPRGQSIVNIENATNGEVNGKNLMDWYFNPKRNRQ